MPTPPASLSFVAIRKPTLQTDSGNAGRIRKARIDDAEAILALEALFPSDRMPMRAIRRFLRVPTAQVWVAELDGAIVGNLIRLTRRGSDAARVYSVVVAPAARGRRLAQRLVKTMEQEATAKGCVRVTLEVRADNVVARALYQKLGYRETMKLPAFYEDDSDGLRLVKALRSDS